MRRLDTCLASLDRGLRSIAGVVEAKRANPADAVAASSPAGDEPLDDAEQRHAAGLMRVNHCGEICAQALYEGQALTARSPAVRDALQAAAQEEADHLAWCRQRLDELHSQPSVLDAPFYAASFLLGAATGLLGDRPSLGFVAATEDGVRRHLDRHLARLPKGDAKSRAILEAMRRDEVRHGAQAERDGGAAYPRPVKAAMELASKAMTATTYRI